jgi:hypothetical protein
VHPGGDSLWNEPLERAIAGVAQPVNRQDMESLRAEVERIAGARALIGLPSKRLAAGSLSDIAHVNRVQGLALGFGGALGLGGGRLQLRPTVGYGTSDHRLVGSLAGTWNLGATRLELAGSRSIADFSDFPVIAPLLNSLTAQEAGDDHGDYVLVHSVNLAVSRRVGGRTGIRASVGLEKSHSVLTRTSPAKGSYRSNPPLGGGSHRTVRLDLERASGGIGLRRDLQGQLSLEFGQGVGEYLRASARGTWTGRLGLGELRARLYGGAGTERLPAYRSFVLGGRGTLVGEPFRAYGGREMALAQVEWRLDVPAPAISLGSYASTGRRITLAPFLAAGYAARPYPTLPWSETDGLRPVAGVAVEWLMQIMRIEAGVGLRDGRIGVTFDFNRDWWGLL